MDLKRVGRQVFAARCPTEPPNFGVAAMMAAACSSLVAHAVAHRGVRGILDAITLKARRAGNGDTQTPPAMGDVLLGERADMGRDDSREQEAGLVSLATAIPTPSRHAPLHRKSPSRE